MNSTLSPGDLRQAIRSAGLNGNTSGLAPGFVQCNVVILPVDCVQHFLQFCQRNPKPCPLIAVGEAGDPTLAALGDIDIRTDVPAYRVFRDGKLAEERPDITPLWRDDLVSFVLGCSFSFEEALLSDGLEVRNISQGLNVPMYRTNIECAGSGPFHSKMVVSMRLPGGKRHTRHTRHTDLHTIPLGVRCSGSSGQPGRDRHRGSDATGLRRCSEDQNRGDPGIPGLRCHSPGGSGGRQVTACDNAQPGVYAAQQPAGCDVKALV